MIRLSVAQILPNQPIIEHSVLRPPTRRLSRVVRYTQTRPKCDTSAVHISDHVMQHITLLFALNVDHRRALDKTTFPTNYDIIVMQVNVTWDISYLEHRRHNQMTTQRPAPICPTLCVRFHTRNWSTPTPDRAICAGEPQRRDAADEASISGSSKELLRRAAVASDE